MEYARSTHETKAAPIVDCRALILEAERELGAFLSAVESMFGFQEIKCAAECWLDALESDSGPFPDGIPAFRNITIQAASRVAYSLINPSHPHFQAREERRSMPEKPSYILIVDDDEDLRDTMASVLADCSFTIRTAADGIAALTEMRRGIPDVLISDLNMPAMCGFELLSIVRRRFPTVGVIAMSAAYSGDEVPPGLAADVFYAKGGASKSPMLKLVNSLVRDNLPRRCPSRAPIWIRPTTEDCCKAGSLIISCPECLRTFLQDHGQSETRMKRAHCPHCNCGMEFAVL